MKAVAEIAQCTLGKMLDKQKNQGTPRPYLRNVNVRWFEFDLTDVLEMRFLDTEAEKFTAKKGDVLICEGGYPGRAAIWDEDDPIFFQKAIHRVRFHEQERNKWFLTPFRVKQYSTTLDEYVYTSDDQVVEGEIEVGDTFDESKFNKTITIEERERKRVKLFLEQIDPKEKTLVFCAKAHQHFADPEWDGPPDEPEVCVECGEYPCVCEMPEPEPCAVCGEDACVCPEETCPECGHTPCVCEKKKNKRVKVKLADGKERAIQHMMVTSFWHPDGTPMSAAQFMEALFGKLPEFFTSEQELRQLWSVPDTRSKLLHGLAESGFGPGALAEMQKLIAAENSDLFDVLAYVAYTRAPVTRQERAALAKPAITTYFTYKQQAFLDFVLAQYVKVGVDELASEKLPPLLKLKYNNAIADAVADLGTPAEIGKVFTTFQQYLYAPELLPDGRPRDPARG